MKQMLLAALCIACLPARAHSAPKESGEFLFYLDENRLITLEFRIQLGEKTIAQAWEEFLDQSFEKLDANKDGQIAAEERTQLPNTRLLALLSRSSLNRVAPSSMSRQAFGKYIEQLGFSPFRLEIESGSTEMTRRVFISGMQNDPDQAAKILFRILDRNSDERLSQEEMEQAVSTLAKQDLDQDETISMTELLPVNLNQYFVSPMSESTPVNQTPFLSLGTGTTIRQVASRLTSKYDTKEKDNALSQAELGVSEKLFENHDIDSNGKWDFEETQQYLRDPSADVLVHVRLEYKSASGKPQIEIKHGTELTSDVKNAIGSLNLGSIQMEFSVEDRWGQKLEDTLKRQFQSMDQDNNGYLDKEEARRFGALQSFFSELDKDSDEKLFAEEVLDAVLPVARLMMQQVRLSVTDRGRDLFRILDSNSDGRLSTREVWAMPNRATLWDKDGDGQITLAEVPQQYRLVASQGDVNLLNTLNGEVAVRSTGNPTNPVRTATTGPIWFQRMDRNQDGDVSDKEFLGSSQDFQRYDLNADGLISLEEAESKP